MVESSHDCIMIDPCSTAGLTPKTRKLCLLNFPFEILHCVLEEIEQTPFRYTMHSGVWAVILAMEVRETAIRRSERATVMEAMEVVDMGMANRAEVEKAMVAMDARVAMTTMKATKALGMEVVKLGMEEKEAVKLAANEVEVVTGMEGGAKEAPLCYYKNLEC